MAKQSSAPSTSKPARKRPRKTNRRNVNRSRHSTDDELEGGTPQGGGEGDDGTVDEDDDIVDATEDVNAAKETMKAQITKELAKRKSVVYAFFRAIPEIGKDNTAEYLIYQCTNCGDKIRQGLKTGDRGSTGNMRDHVKKCWGEEALAAVKDTTLEKARAAVKESKKKKQTTLTLVVNMVQAWFKSFSTRPPEKEKIRVVTV
ncbi:hypothetical protein EV360DRAFT_89704 [Lentinula raphanica]|nr:hypothetical protein EV360DRAFT_89704 [Lentinula raphanica]